MYARAMAKTIRVEAKKIAFHVVMSPQSPANSTIRPRNGEPSAASIAAAAGSSEASSSARGMLMAVARITRQ